MCSFQMCAGYVAPVTVLRANFHVPTIWSRNSGTPRIGVYPRGSPTHTTVEYCGVKPTNHALVLLACVPVLPPAGRSSASGVRRAVPLRSTPRMMSTVFAADERVSASVPTGFGSRSHTTVELSRSKMPSKKYGSWCTPRLAMVWAPAAMSTTLNSLAPVASDAYGYTGYFSGVSHSLADIA